MSLFSESKKSAEKNSQSSPEPIKSLYMQIRKMPELTYQAKVIDQMLLKRLQDLKTTASTILTQFKEQKKIILQRFDHLIMPIAQEVLDRFIQDAQQLKDKLDNNLEHIDQTSAAEWEEQAKKWLQLYENLHNRHVLIEKILEAVDDRTKYLIDKDIQVIKDYQTQSLAHLSRESEVFKNVEERLLHAVEEPLKQLISLRNQPKNYTSLQQASEWVANLQEKRENYFDQLLMKIDHVTKDVVHADDRSDWSSFLELEGELIFMERELHQINIDLAHLNLQDNNEIQFILARLEGIFDHAEDLNKLSLPDALQQRIKALKAGIELAFSHLK